MYNINLLPMYYKEKLKIKKLIIRMIAYMSIIFLLTILLITKLNSIIYKYEEKILCLNKEIVDEKFLKSENIYQNIKKIEKNNNNVDYILSLINNEFESYDNYIPIIVEFIPNNIDIIRLVQNMIENKVNLVLKSKSKNDIFIFIDILTKKNIFNNISILNINNEININKVEIELKIK